MYVCMYVYRSGRSNRVQRRRPIEVDHVSHLLLQLYQRLGNPVTGLVNF